MKVLIVGGGVAALEAALALRELAGERIATTLLAPRAGVRLSADAGARAVRLSPARGATRWRRSRATSAFELRQDAFKWLDPERRVVHTEGGEGLPYDALLLALGAVVYRRFQHALTLDDGRLDEQLHGLIQDVEGGYVRTLAFIVPTPMPWPLPLYELALMTARRAFDMCIELSITLVTPEDAPLAIFGQPVSEKVGRLLEERGIATVTSAHCETPEAREVAIHPGDAPFTRGPRDRAARAVRALRTGCADGILRAGSSRSMSTARCRGLRACSRRATPPISLSSTAGSPPSRPTSPPRRSRPWLARRSSPRRFHPVMHAILLGGEKPLYLSAHITGGHGSSSEISETATWSPPTKIVGQVPRPVPGVARVRRVTVSAHVRGRDPSRGARRAARQARSGW